jgi:hypothetical protein
VALVGWDKEIDRWLAVFSQTTIFHDAAINAWACSDLDEALAKVEALVESMEQSKGSSGPPKPDRITYNTVIKAMSRCDGNNAQRADEVLTLLEKRAKHDSKFQPDAYTYTAVISAYGRSSHKHKAKKSFGVLKRMIDAYRSGNRLARPTISPFNAALNSCAFVKGNEARKMEAYTTALTIMIMLRQHVIPDHTTYGTLLRACSTLLSSPDPQRQAMVASIFREACAEGRVGKLVLTQVRFGADSEQYRMLVGHDKSIGVSLDDLPLEWTCNVRENRKRRLNHPGKS